MVDQFVGQLIAAGLAEGEARRDAVRLARSLLDWDQARWLVDQRMPASPEFVAALQALVERRRARQPIAHLLGEREFYGRPFRVSPDVLIPRPETEGLVSEALAVLSRATEVPSAIVDVGTGSGCVAITLAAERPDLLVTATDVSAPALNLARQNAADLGVTGRVAFVRGSLLDPVEGAIELIVSNPPYVPTTDRDALAPEVRDHEPALALFAGVDGLDVIRALVAAADRRLSPGGWLLFEMGAGQADGVADLAATTERLELMHIRPDLQGISRIAAMRARVDSAA